MNSDAILTQILAQVQALQVSQQALAAKVETLQPSTTTSAPIAVPATTIAATTSPSPLPPSHSLDATSISTSPPPGTALTSTERKDKEREKVLYPGRVLLTTYPDQHGIQPYPLTWFSPDPSIRGPIICSRLPSSIKRRNAIGAHSGSYSIYRALSIGMGTLDPAHRPDYSMTAPPVEIPPNEAWWTPGKIVYGKQTPIKTVEEGGEGLYVRPSIAVTRAHIKLSEIGEAVRRGEIEVDGKIVLKSAPLRNEDGTVNEKIDPGVEVAVSKAAVEPVWYLPGVAERFGISETLLRRALFEETGGMYPELITRPDIKVFLPPIGNLTVYIFGNPSLLSSPTAHLTLRVHDECNGSDVFGSDICTCKPYLTYAMEECIRTAQGKQEDMVRDGKTEGVGVVVYFRKEGRALGEVTKYLVYNLRKRAGDSADKYFQSTEIIAGVKDMRHQALMPDVLHWLGIKKVDGMVSMSDMKYDAVVGSGIGIGRRYDLPDHLIPPDSRVEIDAKIASGYFSSRTGEKGMGMTQEELRKTVGRGWEEVEH
ncbi:hypothetical protein K435DRAFT_778100 [Dendrothele bispora CBS 962.96]|uniref:Cyclohydrolase n=1 Tax=Dendrothele bispora (strain CBS 962.96) TaxID=1314807 RepID=A0A4S8M5T5_DENBC|nr:hypothetical protein K435DRAFT_778100 [Dendrothele bispora CBS 962.96]